MRRRFGGSDDRPCTGKRQEALALLAVAMLRPMDRDLDSAVRSAAFAFLAEQCRIQGEELPWRTLLKGFEFGGRRVPLVSMQGIFKPALLDLPLTIRTAPSGDGPRPYEDEHSPGGLLSYCYRDKDPQHHENRRLRECMRQHLPLVYLIGLAKGWYRAFWPVFVVGDSPATHRFQVAIDDEMYASIGHQHDQTPEAVARRRYVTAQHLRRLHQDEFRARVLAAYQERCAVCRLRYRVLLDAAHILSDKHPRGDPVVPNGLSMCKIHHAAFDQHILGIRPDTRIEVRADILREKDGPMLLHGLQGFQGQRICLPRPDRLKPDRARLEERFEIFLRAC